MKSWNRKGSRSAHVRMQELREQKLQHRKVELMNEWAAATGRPAVEWWHECQAAGIGYGSPTEARIDWLKGAIAKARAA